MSGLCGTVYVAEQNSLVQPDDVNCERALTLSGRTRITESYTFRLCTQRE